MAGGGREGGRERRERRERRDECFDVKNMGEGAVKSHGAGAKHVANMTQSKQLTRTTNSVSTFFMQPTMDNLLLAITFIVRTIKYLVRTLQEC